MKKYMFLWIFMGGVFPTFAQETLENFLGQIPSLVSGKYQVDSGFEGHFMVQMSFEDSKVLNPKELALLKSKEIVAIDLVYTLFPANKDFTQLNTNRLEALSKTFPALLSKKNISWRTVGQSGCKNRSEAQRFFHGFVIYYRSFSQMQKLQIPDEIVVDQEVDLDDPDFMDAPSLRALLQHDYLPPDSTVYKILERNQNQWDASLAVIDWTGSMYSYGFQLLVWLKLHLEDTSRFSGLVFFNDGDNKLPGEKIIGSTGGIYPSSSKNLQAIIRTMSEVQKGGNGGYDEENDLEALIRAQEMYPNSKNIILIADSRSFVRDMVLLDYFTKKCLENQQKLRIILCGVEESLATDYLYIAAKTGGSIHTLNQDIEEIFLTEDEQFVNREGQIYELNQGTMELRSSGKKKRMRASQGN